MNVTLPNGQVIEGVPDGTSKADLAAKLTANGMDVPKEWVTTPPKAAPDPSPEMERPVKAEKIAMSVSAPKPAKEQEKPGYLDQVIAGVKKDVPNMIDAAELLNPVSYVAGVAKELKTRYQEDAKGTPHKEASEKAAKAGSEEAEKYSVRKFMNYAGINGPDAEKPSAVAQVTEKAGNWLSKGGAWVEEKTKGALTKEDVGLVAKVLPGLSTVGKVAKAGSHIAKAGAEAVKVPVEEKPVLHTKDMTEPTAPTPTTPPEQLGAKHSEEAPLVKAKPHLKLHVEGGIEPAAREPKRPIDSKEPGKTVEYKKQAREKLVPQEHETFRENAHLLSAHPPPQEGVKLDFPKQGLKSIDDLRNAALDPEKADAVKQYLYANGVEPSKVKMETWHADPEFSDKAAKVAREHFSNDHQFTQYLEAGLKEKSVRVTPESKVADFFDPKKEGPPEKWDVVKPIFEKPAFLRTPGEIVRANRFNKQGGQADPYTLAKMAAIGLGVMGGIAIDANNPVEGGILGGLGAFGAMLGVQGFGKVAKAAFRTDDRIRVPEMLNSFEVSQAQNFRAISQSIDGIQKAVPETKKLQPATAWLLDGNKSLPLTPSQHQAAMIADQFFKDANAAALHHGIEKEVAAHYATDLWDLKGQNKQAWEKAIQGRKPAEVEQMMKGLQSPEFGKHLGMKPVTDDLKQMVGMYGNAVSRMGATKQLRGALKNTPAGIGSNDRLAMNAADAPKDYVDMPGLPGMKVHPDIKPSLDMFFQQRSPGLIKNALELVNDTAKRSGVSYSLFHPYSLALAYINAGGNALKIPAMLAGTSKYLDMLRTGGAGDMVDMALRGGLKFSYNMGKLVDEDIRGDSFYGGLKWAQKKAAEFMPPMQYPIKGMIAASEYLDKMMWERLHAGMKLELFGKYFSKMKTNNAAAHAKNPNVMLLSDDAIAHEVAGVVNKFEGGLNWRRIAEDSTSKWGRDLKMSIMSPNGRKELQLMMYAPDWTYSTTASALGVFKKGSGMKGLIHPQAAADFHRQYMVRAALYHFTINNGLNMALAGHPIWENKDPTRLELFEGNDKEGKPLYSTIEIGKHSVEPARWLMHPVQEGANKLSYVASEAANQWSGTDYIHMKGLSNEGPPMDKSVSGRAKHALKRAMPISSQGSSPAEILSSTLGVPYRDNSPERKEEKRIEMRAIYKKNRELSSAGSKAPKKKAKSKSKLLKELEG